MDMDNDMGIYLRKVVGGTGWRWEKGKVVGTNIIAQKNKKMRFSLYNDSNEL